MVSSPGNQSDLPTSPGEVFVLCFSVGVVFVVTSCVVCKYLVVLYISDGPLAKVRASPDNNIKNSFAPQNEPHIDKLSFSGSLKQFRGNIQKNSL